MLPEKWVKLTSSSRNTVLAALVLIGLICLYNWIISPHTAYLQAAERYDLVADELAKKNRILLGKINNHKEELEKLKGKLEQVGDDLFSSAGADEFFSSIQSICEQEKCVMESLQFRQVKSVSEGDEDTITIKHATLVVVGRYKNIIALMNKLQKRPQRVWIDSLDVVLIRDHTAQLNCKINITVYVMDNKEGNFCD